MELRKQIWITLFILSIADGAVINSNKNISSHLIPCEEGWFLFGDKCYKIFEKSNGVTWQSGEVSCEVHRGNLATVQSKELQDFLRAFLQLDVPSNVWIGLNDRQEESKFVWVDGSIVNYKYWEAGQPNNARRFSTLNEDQDCVEMQFAKEKDSWEIGMWNDMECNTKLPFMCQTNKSEQSRSNDPRFCTGDNDGAWKYQNSCYHAVNKEMSWDDAENYCQTVLNGHLLTIMDYKVELFINYVLSDFNKEFWIGIKIRDAAQQMWSSAWMVRYKKFNTNREHNVNGTCAYKTENRLWSTAPCFKKLPFVCEVPEVKPPSLKPAPEGWKCPELSQDWIDLGGDTCYIFETTKQKQWHEANFACLKKGGHLASISSLAEENAIRRRVMGGAEEMHIGLHRSLSDNSVFEWADGTVFDYKHWGFNQPNSGIEGCVEVMTETMDWHDIPCDFRRGYICSAKKVPSFLRRSNETLSTDSQLLVETNCSAVGKEKIIEDHGSFNIVLTVLFFAVIILSIVGFTIYAYKNHCRKINYRSWKCFTMSFSARKKSGSKELAQVDPIITFE